MGFGTTRRECRCSPLQIQRYVGRISGPPLDRIDIHIDVPAVKFRELAGDASPDAESSAMIRQRSIKARERQRERFSGEKIFSNAAMTPRMILCLRIAKHRSPMVKRFVMLTSHSQRGFSPVRALSSKLITVLTVFSAIGELEKNR